MTMCSKHDVAEKETQRQRLTTRIPANIQVSQGSWIFHSKKSIVGRGTETGMLLVVVEVEANLCEIASVIPTLIRIGLRALCCTSGEINHDGCSGKVLDIRMFQ